MISAHFSSFGTTLGSLPRQAESQDGESNDVGAKDRLGFDRHGEKPSSSLGIDYELYPNPAGPSLLAGKGNEEKHSKDHPPSDSIKPR